MYEQSTFFLAFSTKGHDLAPFRYTLNALSSFGVQPTSFNGLVRKGDSGVDVTGAPNCNIS